MILSLSESFFVDMLQDSQTSSDAMNEGKAGRRCPGPCLFSHTSTQKCGSINTYRERSD